MNTHCRIIVGLPLSEVYTETDISDTVTCYVADTGIPYQKKVKALDRTFCGKSLARLIYEAERGGYNVKREWDTIEALCDRKMTTYFPFYIDNNTPISRILGSGVVGLHVGIPAKTGQMTVAMPDGEIQKTIMRVMASFAKLGVNNPIRVFLQLVNV